MVIKRMMWKVLCNGKKETNCIKAEWYGLKCSKTPKQVKELIPSDNDVIALVQNIIHTFIIHTYIHQNIHSQKKV